MQNNFLKRVVLAVGMIVFLSNTSWADERVMVINGIGFASYRLDEALDNIEVKPYYMEVGLGLSPKVQTKLERSPGRGSIEKSNLIIMVDATADCFGNYTQGLIAKYVEDGGSLLVLGGPFTYGKGHFKGTVLEKVMPVEINGPWEMKKAQTPLAIKVVKGGIFNDGFKWEKKPAVFYYHDLKPKPESEVILRGGEIPLLVVWNYGQGKVAAFSGTTLGMAEEGTIPFWEWEDWPRFLNNLVGWLRGHGGGK